MRARGGGPAGLTRRQWLSSTAGGALSLLAGCNGPPSEIAGDGAGGAGLPFDGPGPLPMAAFEVDHRSAILWAAAPAAGELVLDIASARQSASFTIRLETGAYNTGFVTIEDLEPATEYRCRVSGPFGRLAGATGFTTAPPPDADAGLRFAVSADIHHDWVEGSPVLAGIAGSGADFYVNLGDWPYSDRPPDAVTLEEYRERHWAIRSPAVVRELLSRVPIFAIYDDHDIMCNFDGRDRERYPDRVAAGLAAWDEFFPLRRAPRYRSWRWGRHAELFLLDTRAYRSADDAPDDGTKTMLGADQKAWLMEALAASDATFKLILSSVPFNYCKPVDDWEVFARERDEILAFLRDQSISKVLLLSADRHYFAAHQHPDDLREFHLGPAAAGLGLPAPDIPEVIASVHEQNFGEIEIRGGDAPELRFVCRNGDGAALYEETFLAG